MRGGEGAPHKGHGQPQPAWPEAGWGRTPPGGSSSTRLLLTPAPPFNHSLVLPWHHQHLQGRGVQTACIWLVHSPEGATPGGGGKRGKRGRHGGRSPTPPAKPCESAQTCGGLGVEGKTTVGWTVTGSLLEGTLGQTPRDELDGWGGAR